MMQAGLTRFDAGRPLAGCSVRGARRFTAGYSRRKSLPAIVSSRLLCRGPTTRRDVKQLHSASKFDGIARLAKTVAKALRSLLRIALFQGLPHSTTQKGTFVMKSAIVMKVAALAVVVGLAGCQDLKPLQSDIADLKSQVSKLQSDVQAAKSSADQASSSAQAASQAASGAQSTANQALAAAQAAQSAVDATNEKLDRMFKRSVSK
jgi:methyl-accepting chemotaxis protein